MSLKEEAQYLIKVINKGIKAIRNGTESFPYTDFPKHIIELMRVEAQFKGMKYHPSRVKLQRFFRKDKTHLIHKAMELRKKKPTRNEVLGLIKDSEKYIKDFKKKFTQKIK